MPNRLAELEELLNTPYARSVLDFIADMEGTSGRGDQGYNIAFGGSTFNDFSQHPGVERAYLGLDGRRHTSDAAGRYQFLQSTYNDLRDRYGIPDFSPHSQDLMAMALIVDVGGEEALRSGDFPALLEKLNQRWASIPGTTLGRNLHNPQTIAAAYSSYLRRLDEHDPSGTALTRPEYSGTLLADATSSTNIPEPTPLPEIPQRPEFVTQLMNHRYAARRLGLSPAPLTPGTADSLATVLLNPALANSVAFTIPQPLPEGVTAIQYPAIPEQMPNTGVRVVNSLYPNDLLTAPYKPEFVLAPISEEQINLGNSINSLLEPTSESLPTTEEISYADEWLRNYLDQQRSSDAALDFLNLNRPYTQDLLALIDRTNVSI